MLRQVDQVLDGTVLRLDPDDAESVAAVARLRAECVDAKEALSRDVDVAIPVSLPGVRSTVRLTRDRVRGHGAACGRRDDPCPAAGAERRGVAPADVQAVLLVGGSSRIPLVGQMVSAELGRPVAVDAHPKHAIAEGAAVAAAQLSGAATADTVTVVATEEPPVAAAAAASAAPPAPAPSPPGFVAPEVRYPHPQGDRSTRAGPLGGRRCSSAPMGEELGIVVFAGEELWYLDMDGAALIRIARDTVSRSTTVDLPGPPSDVLFAVGSLWVTLEEDNQVVRVDVASGEIDATIDVGPRPTYIVGDDEQIWVAVQGVQGLALIDPTANEVVETLEL